ERNAPVIVAQPRSITVTEGDPAVFQVEATGAESYHWRRDGMPLAGAVGATYSIPAATLADDGAVFDVIVSNPGGSVVSAPATLAVRLAPPRIVSEPADLEVVEGAPAAFSVGAEGTNLRYQWR